MPHTNIKKVAIIIPVYNAEAYLQACLLSIERQTFKNFIALIINDGSTDKSVDILKYWSLRDSRFKYFSKPNGGVSSARNFILNKIFSELNNQFEYITFIDSDDVVDQNYLLELVTTAEKHCCDISICEYKTFKSPPTHIQPNVINKKEDPVSSDQFLSALFSIGKWKFISIQGMVWGKLYKSDLLQNIRFTEDNIVEDEAFNTSILCSSSSHIIIYHINEKLYFYRNNDTSLSKQSDFYMKLVAGRIFCYKKACQSALPQAQIDIILLSIADAAIQGILLGNSKIRNLLRPYHQAILDANKRKKSLSLKKNISA